MASVNPTMGRRHSRNLHSSLPAVSVILIALAVACRDTNSPGVDPVQTASVATVSATQLTDEIPPGTIALFDTELLTATKLDLGRSLIFADWVDDGETILALDVNSFRFVAIHMDGTVVREIAKRDGRMYASAVRDDRRVAITDLEHWTFELVDVFSGLRERLHENAMVAGFFSPDGRYMAGGATPIDAAQELDADASVRGVFAQRGACGDTRPYACIEWEWVGEPGTVLGPVREPWSPDGKHLLLQRTGACPRTNPGTPTAPCRHEPAFEVYSWPGRELVLSLPASQFGEAQWAGPSALRVNGLRDPNLGPTYLVTLDGRHHHLPEVLRNCCVSFSPDGRYAVDSVTPGEDCSLIDVESGETLASVPRGPGDNNDTGICQYVSWTQDGRWAIATGVNAP